MSPNHPDGGLIYRIGRPKTKKHFKFDQILQ